MSGVGVVDNEWLDVVRSRGGVPPPQFAFRGMGRRIAIFIEESFKTMYPDVEAFMEGFIPKLRGPRHAWELLRARPFPSKCMHLVVCLHGSKADAAGAVKDPQKPRDDASEKIR